MNRAVEEKDLKIPIALYINRHGRLLVNQVMDWIEGHADYVRVTEIIDIEFTDLDDELVLTKRVKSIDKQISDVRAQLTAEIAALTDEKNRLLAITHDSHP